MEHDINKAINMKLILCIFEQLSGLKNNFHKSDYFVLVKLRTWSINISKYLDENVQFYHSDILAYLFTIEFYEMWSGILWRVVLCRSLVVGAVK
jgi:hypothetical protein